MHSAVLRKWRGARRASGLSARLCGTATDLVERQLLCAACRAMIAELLLNTLSQFVRWREDS